MSYFQVSPGQTKQKPTKAVNNEEVEIATLTLAPFTPIPKLSFQDVAVNAVHDIKLHVLNKKPVPVFVNAYFDGPEELEFSQSWCEQRIEANDGKMLELYWYPNTEYSERHNLKVTCAKQMWNVPITFKSVLPKKTKKKLTTTLVKKTSPSLKKNTKKSSQKLSTAASKPPTKKQPVWNDKPYIPKQVSRDKENFDNNFQPSTNISFKITTPDNLRRFTYAVNKMGFTKDLSPDICDGLGMVEDPHQRIVLKGIQLNSPSLDEFVNKNMLMNSLSYLGTPVSQFFKPSRVSSELPKKNETEEHTMDNPRVIRNLSFEMNCEVQPSLNISSETRIIGNLSSDSLRKGFDGNTFIKNNISTGTYIKDDNSFEIPEERYSLDSLDRVPLRSPEPKVNLLETHKNTISTKRHMHSRRSLEVNRESLNSTHRIKELFNSDVNVTSGTYVKEEDISSDSFTEKLRQIGEPSPQLREDKRFEQNVQFRASYCNNTSNSNKYCQRRNTYNKSEINPTDYLSRQNRNVESPSTSPFRNSPKRIEVFPSNEIQPTIKLKDGHNLFPIREEPTDESLRRTQTKRKSDGNFTFSPLKRQNVSPETWSKVGGVYKTRLSIQRSTKLLTSKQKDKQKNPNDTSFLKGAKGITYVEKKTLSITDPFILAATTAVDPFLTNTIYLDQDWIQRHEERFKNWLNMLLTPPVDLEVSDEGQQVDAAKLWRECSQKEVAVAPTKEEVCSKYHTSTKLEILRRSAHELYNRDIIQSVLNKIYDAIEKKKIEIRPDRNVHLDLSLQSKVMSLLLSYNPLWLRIALETIYGEKLKLTSNSDMLGLSRFLYERFFKDRILVRKYKTVHNPKYTVDIKKFILKKYFSIVYFLDKAKINTLIPHDPCLFRKNAPVKESREMLIQFSRDAITAAVGDITKYLKYFGYLVEHQQHYIHEFDYAVNSLGGDLRDGVRLTRVMELILLRKDLIKNLRVPAISKLQKIHNVKVVFEALAGAGYEIQHEIEPYHIVEGHREKTLSFLWQIIYKFQAPLVIETAKSIQKWWRSLPVCVKRMKCRRQYLKKVEAATKIQRWYRHLKQSRELLQIASLFKEYMEEKRKERAAVKIQSFYRMYKQQKYYINIREMVIKLQRKCRFWLENVCYRQRESAAVIIQKNVKRFLAQRRYISMKHSVLVIENYMIARKLMLLQQQQFVKIRCSAIVIQRWYRAVKLMRINQKEYLELKTAACLIQNRFRSLLMMRKASNEYAAIKSSTIVIQKWYRSTSKMRELRNRFLSLKHSVITIENRYRAQKDMKRAKSWYQQLRCSSIVIQRHLRATLQMKIEHNYYVSLKSSVNFVKTKYRANKMMFRDRENYLNLKRHVIFIQRKFRANKLMQIERNSYLLLKNSTIIIQNYFRGYLVMKKTRKNYMDMKMSAMIIQQRYRAYKSMCLAKKEYENLRKSVILIQTKFRANNAMKLQRQEFLRQKQSCVLIQRYYRGFCLMRKERQEYLQLRSVSCFIQQKYRAKLAMKECRDKYMKLKEACIIIQQRFRANKIMQKQKTEYETLKKAVDFVKSKFLAKKKMLKARDNYQRLKKYTILVQDIYRATKLMKIERRAYLERRDSAIKIQNYVRGYLLMKNERKMFCRFKFCVIIIQRLFRAQRAMVQTRDYYNRLKQAVLFIQQKFRANRLMRKERSLYIAKRSASINIQRYYRSYLLMKKQRQQFISMKNSAIIIQQRYIAYRKMCTEQTYYRSLKKAVITVQIRFRSKKLMEQQRQLYLEQRRCCIVIQEYCRGYLLMKKERQSYLTLKSATRVLQEKYRAKRAMETCRESYQKLRQMAVCVQSRYRANQAMKIERMNFLTKKEAAIKIQNYFRGYQQMKKDRKNFLSLTASINSIQRFSRGFLTRKKYAHLLTAEAREERRIKKAQEIAATKIQAHWRGFKQRRSSNSCLVEIRKRSESAARNADPQNSLQSRTDRAFEMLVNEDISVALIIAALTDFEYVTRRSPEICNKVGPVLPVQLYLLIQSVARSLPDISICELSAYILINLCKYKRSAATTWHPQYLDSMLKIMTHWCDKENMAFPSLCTLFWLFAHNKEYKKTILELPNLHQRIQKIHSLVLRKQKMVMKSESKVLNSRFISKKPLYLPGLKPDWGFDYPKRPRLFMNSVQAIECLIKILNST